MKSHGDPASSGDPLDVDRPVDRPPDPPLPDSLFSGEILHGDCRELLPDLPDRSFSLLLTDPPYFLDRMGADWDHRELSSRSRRARERRGVVGGLPAGMKFSPAQGRALYEFLLPLARQWFRLLRPGSFALLFSHPRLSHRAACALEDAGFEIRDLLAWRREGQAKAFTQDHFIRRRNLPPAEEERLLGILGGRRTPQLRPQFEILVLAQAPREGTFADNFLHHRTGLIETTSRFLDPAHFPGTLLDCPKPRKEQRFGQLTAKPVPLLRHLIRLFSSPGREQRILDPFLGSGSSAVAARLEKRGFLGMELEEEMVSVSRRRLQRMEAEQPYCSNCAEPLEEWGFCSPCGR